MPRTATTSSSRPECLVTWYWIADVCAAEGITFVLGHALAMKAIYGGKSKNDKIDSHKIASLVRGGLLPQSYVYPARMRSTRDLLRRRRHLVRKRGQLLAHMQNTRAQYNLPEFERRLAYWALRAAYAPLRDGGEGPERVLTSLKMSPAELIKQRHHRRVAPSSEIASIIDALIYQLGIRSAAEAPPPPAPENEEPEAAPEPEKPDDDPKEPTGAERAAQCRSKVNSLFSRMTTQLEAAEGVGRNVTVAIVQLAAVLGIVKYLRLGIVDWLPKNDRLVDAVKARKFFTNVCRSLYGPTRDLAGRALVENNGQPFDELTSVRALLAWLALDSGVNAETLPRDLKDAPDSASALVLGVACLLPVATECAQDSHAGALLVHTLAEQPSEAARAERHLTWARRVHAAVSTSKTPASGPFRLGDIVVPFKAKFPKPFVVSQVLHGKTGVLDLDRLDHKHFADGWLAPIELPPL